MQATAVQQCHQLVKVSFCHIQSLLQGQQRLLQGEERSFSHLLVRLAHRPGPAHKIGPRPALRPRPQPTAPPTHGQGGRVLWVPPTPHSSTAPLPPSPWGPRVWGAPTHRPALKGTEAQLLSPGPAAGSGCWPELAGTESASAEREREGGGPRSRRPRPSFLSSGHSTRAPGLHPPRNPGVQAPAPVPPPPFRVQISGSLNTPFPCPQP